MYEFRAAEDRWLTGKHKALELGLPRPFGSPSLRPLPSSQFLFPNTALPSQCSTRQAFRLSQRGTSWPTGLSPYKATLGDSIGSIITIPVPSSHESRRLQVNRDLSPPVLMNMPFTRPDSITVFRWHLPLLSPSPTWSVKSHCFFSSPVPWRESL